MRSLLFTIAFFVSFSCYSQSVDSNFVKDFTAALDNHFSDTQLDTMFHRYNQLLTPHSDVTQLWERLQGHEVVLFPLYYFKNEKIYTANIDKLLHSKNPNQRLLAYLVIASSGDSTKEAPLLLSLKTENDKNCLIWNGMALLYLKCNHTTPLFDFLVNNEDFGDAHMLPLFIKLNKDSLQQTAYNRIHSNNDWAKILAAQTLAYTDINPKTEQLLKDAVKDWDIHVKGYAIYSLYALQAGNLLEVLKPLLDSSETRTIALQALANSPTKNDQDYLKQLVNKQDTTSEELLSSFYNSKRLDNIRYWLTIITTKPVPANYHFFVFKQPLLSSDSTLPNLQNTLEKVKDPEVLSELLRALQNRTDEKSVDILIAAMDNSNETVRYWAAKTAEDNHSPKLQDQKVKDTINKILAEAK